MSLNLVDSCGWLEYLAGGANAQFFTPPLTDLAHLLVPSVCLLEVVKVVWRQRGERDAQLAAATMQQGLVVDLDRDIALLAASLGLELRLPLADSVILATARQHQAVVWTQDAHFQGLPGVRCQPRP